MESRIPGRTPVVPLAHALVDTPLGTMRAFFDGEAVCGLYFLGQKHERLPQTGSRRDDESPLARALREQLDAYFAGVGRGFSLPLRLHGTPFQSSVWQALQAIDAGDCCSYRDIATRIGAPAAVRAVAAAIGRNPVSIVVPCHRVIGSDGALTGYAGGLERKQRLLALEGLARPTCRDRRPSTGSSVVPGVGPVAGPTTGPAPGPRS